MVVVAAVHSLHLNNICYSKKQLQSQNYRMNRISQAFLWAECLLSQQSDLIRGQKRDSARKSHLIHKC